MTFVRRFLAGLALTAVVLGASATTASARPMHQHMAMSHHMLMLPRLPTSITMPMLASMFPSSMLMPSMLMPSMLMPSMPTRFLMVPGHAGF